MNGASGRLLTSSASRSKPRFPSPSEFRGDGRATPSREMVGCGCPIRFRRCARLTTSSRQPGFAPVLCGACEWIIPACALPSMRSNVVLKGHEPYSGIARRPATGTCRFQRVYCAPALGRRGGPVAPRWPPVNVPAVLSHSTAGACAAHPFNLAEGPGKPDRAAAPADSRPPPTDARRVEPLNWLPHLPTLLTLSGRREDFGPHPSRPGNGHSRPAGECASTMPSLVLPSARSTSSARRSTSTLSELAIEFLLPRRRRNSERLRGAGGKGLGYCGGDTLRACAPLQPQTALAPDDEEPAPTDDGAADQGMCPARHGTPKHEGLRRRRWPSSIGGVFEGRRLVDICAWRVAFGPYMDQAEPAARPGPTRKKDDSATTDSADPAARSGRQRREEGLAGSSKTTGRLSPLRSDGHQAGRTSEAWRRPRPPPSRAGPSRRATCRWSFRPLREQRQVRARKMIDEP